MKEGKKNPAWHTESSSTVSLILTFLHAGKYLKSSLLLLYSIVVLLSKGEMIMFQQKMHTDDSTLLWEGFHVYDMSFQIPLSVMLYNLMVLLMGSSVLSVMKCIIH